MDERRNNKNNAAKYKEIQNLIRRKIRRAKEDWVRRECEAIEEYEKKYDSFNLHKKIKELTGMAKHKQPRVIKDKNGTLIIDIKQQLLRWSEYIKDLF